MSETMPPWTEEAKKNFRLKHLLPKAMMLAQSARFEDAQITDAIQRMDKARQDEGINTTAAEDDALNFDLGDKTITQTGIDPEVLLQAMVKRQREPVSGWVPILLSALLGAGVVGSGFTFLPWALSLLNQPDSSFGIDQDKPFLDLSSADEIIDGGTE